MEFKSINPFTGEVLETFAKHGREKINARLNRADKAFGRWRDLPVLRRCALLTKVGDLLLDNIDQYAGAITAEMGKPIIESRAEIEKCAWLCDYYSQNAEVFLADNIIDTDADESFVSYDPLGGVLAIMPWNFPFWQVFRFAAPALSAGNTGLLKHAANVCRCSLLIEALFEKAGFPEGVFQSLLINHDEVDDLISHDTVKAVTLTGSERAGVSVGAAAGKNIKKSVLELGGSNAFIVWDDADIDKAIKVGVKSRMQNTGQSCIAAKRFFVMENVYDEFLSGFIEEVRGLRHGDPMDEHTAIGPLAREDLAEKLQDQVDRSVSMGAVILTGGERNKAMYRPAVMTNVKPGMPVFDEETFGPVAPIMKVKHEDEAFELAESTGFGLGLTLFTNNIEKARKHVGRIGGGCFFINELVKSDPRLPFGGTKRSGYGRELSKDGIMEFVNKKTVFVRK